MHSVWMRGSKGCRTRLGWLHCIVGLTFLLCERHPCKSFSLKSTNTTDERKESGLCLSGSFILELKRILESLSNINTVLLSPFA